MSTSPSLDDMRVERELLLCLLDFVDHEQPSKLVTDALELVATRAGASQAYLEIGEVREGGIGWWASTGFDVRELDQHLGLISTTVVREALASGQPVESASASSDPRFGAADSVRFNQIEKVLCVPIGQPPVGVVYLQHLSRGVRFPEEARRWAERFARQLGPVARRLVTTAAVAVADPTAPHRAKLRGSETLIGRSAAWADALRLVATVASLDVPLLLTGPSGTGKTELAKVIAQSSPRRAGPFVPLNCAALPVDLLESELFGALPGAHSTAHRKVVGKVEAAQGGTLFLDEVGELPLAAQAKLLQLLQDGTYWPLGAARPSRADIRVVAATNRDLQELVRAAKFREDLLFRLDVVRVAVPSLAERRTDIPILAERFVAEASDRHGLPRLTLAAEARHALMVAEWPGNIRQLQHAILAAAVRCHSDASNRIEVGHCFPERRSEQTPIGSTWQSVVRDFQRSLLRDALRDANGNVTEAARRLGVARSHAFELVKDLGLRGEGR